MHAQYKEVLHKPQSFSSLLTAEVQVQDTGSDISKCCRRVELNSRVIEAGKPLTVMCTVTKSDVKHKHYKHANIV